MIGFRWNFALTHQGDLLSRTSLPENYYKNTGDKLVNIDNLDFFKYNPYVIQGSDIHPNTLSRVEVRDIWRYRARDKEVEWPTMAHQIGYQWGLDKIYKTRPDLYIYKNSITYPRNIVVAPQGQCVGAMPLHVLNYIREKYKDYLLFQVGAINDIDANIDIDRRGCNFWESAKLISESEQLITIDSLPMWIGLCYPQVRIKVVLVNKSEEECEKFLPVGIKCSDSSSWKGWIHCGCEYYNTFEHDLGITLSYKSI